MGELHRGAKSIKTRIVDVASGGICVRLGEPGGHPPLVGERVRLELTPDACPSVHFALEGHVVRSSLGDACIAIALDKISAAYATWLRDEYRAAVHYDAAPHVVLVDNVVSRRHEIAKAFRHAGCRVSEMATPDQAIRRLGHSRFAPGVIAISDTVPEAVAEQLREALLDENPRVHLVSICRCAAHRDHSQSWLSSTDPRGDLQLRVDRVVTAHDARRRAVTTSPLVRALHRSPG